MRKRIPQSFINELLIRINIIDIISPRIALRKKANNYTANCPFHLEKTPSFSVSESKQFYHCFGCSAHGNAIDFLIHYDHLDFIGAIETLAAYAGIIIPQEIKESTQIPDYADICKHLSLAANFYHRQLLSSQKAVDYVKSRGLTKEIIKKYTIGYAPAGWDNLIKNIETSDELVRGGMLIQKDQGGFYDRFRDRIMFPIRDSRGQVIAFGGRTLSDDTPKYLNSPETSVFHKSSELYALYEARLHSKQLKSFIIVEGYMDVIALAQYGFSHTVATLGTAISQEHIQKLLRHVKELFFCFDGDPAGQRAAWRALEASLPLLRDDVRMRFVFLDPNDDPDTFIRREGSEAFQAKLDQAIALPDFFFSELIEQTKPKGLDGRSHLAKLAMDLLNKIPAGIFKQLMLDELAKQVNIDVGNLISSPSAKSEKSAKKEEIPKINKNTISSSQLALCLLLQNPLLAKKLNPNDIELCVAEEDLKKDANLILLIKLIKLLKKNPELNTAALLEYWRERDNALYLAKLASWPHLLSPTSACLSDEFLGSMAQIKNQYRKKTIQKLLNKAKTSVLSLEEKQTLNTLIMQKNTCKNTNN